ncbi:flavin monoamine oxidase family protein [Kribbella speibonae]|uniref:FAD-binding protein n=1 Tax=Kribbella speibonae TaxID=1572660 RepID=A0A4R0IRM1_9ACTN|nr:NAD(P)/FAD-dependent oxidoreductase [Kribbella speibonae]TCC36441.1 FAD-binding protein [Kribbella speibonae]
MRIAVIGAGLAGLAAADELHRAGADVEVFEASERVGGRVWSVPFGELGTVERGAEFVFPGYDEQRRLIDRFSLELRRKGMPYGVREPRGGEPTSSEEMKAAVERLETDLTDMGVTDDCTVSEALRIAGVPSAVAEALKARVEISCGHIADDLSVSELTSAGFDDSDSHTIVGGNMRLAECLAASLERPVNLNVPVTRVSQTGTGVVVGTASGEISADAAVVAVPARLIDDITFEPALPAAKQTKSLLYAHGVKLFVRLVEPVPPSATLSVPGRYWCYTELDRDGAPRHMLSALANTDSGLAGLDIDNGPELWLDALEQLRPDLRLDRSAVMLCTWHDQPWIRAVQVARSVARPVDDEAVARPVGRLSFAGEHTAGEGWHGSMEGAIRSGQRAASEALAAARGQCASTAPR